MGDAARASDWVALIGVDDDLADGSLDQLARHRYLLGQANSLVGDGWKRESLCIAMFAALGSEAALCCPCDQFGQTV